MFKLIRKFVGIACLFAGFASGQNTGQNVVTVIAIPQQNLVSVTGRQFTIGPLQNIGQSSHIAKVVVTGNGGSTWSLTSTIQGSNDGITYFNIGSYAVGGGGSGAGGIVTVTGTQSFPYLEFSLNITTTGTVGINAVYTGNSSPAIVQADLTDVIVNLLNTTSAGSGATSTALTTTAIPTGAIVVVYGLDLYISADVASLLVRCHTLTSQHLINIPVGTVPASISHFHYEVELRPYGSCPANDYPELVTTGTATAFGFTTIYRLE